MPSDQHEAFRRASGFEWDESKRRANIEKHGLDFADAVEVFDDMRHYTYASPVASAEQRYVSVGMVRGWLVAVAPRNGAANCGLFQRGLPERVSETDMRNKKENEAVVTLVASLSDGTFIVEHQDGHLERKRSQTDWERLKALTDEEIEKSVADDPDWQEVKDLDWSEAIFVVPPKKRPISIRIDGDVLDFFKGQGAGYQKRINAVLRSYMNATSKKKRA